MVQRAACRCPRTGRARRAGAPGSSSRTVRRGRRGADRPSPSVTGRRVRRRVPRGSAGRRRPGCSSARRPARRRPPARSRSSSDSCLERGPRGHPGVEQAAEQSGGQRVAGTDRVGDRHPRRRVAQQRTARAGRCAAARRRRSGARAPTPRSAQRCAAASRSLSASGSSHSRSSALTLTTSARATSRSSRSRTTAAELPSVAPTGPSASVGRMLGSTLISAALSVHPVDQPGDGLGPRRRPARDRADVQDARCAPAGRRPVPRRSTASRRHRGRGSRSRGAVRAEARPRPGSPARRPRRSRRRRRRTVRRAGAGWTASGPVPSRASSRTGTPSRPAATATLRALPPGRATYCGAVPCAPGVGAPRTGSRSTTSSPRTTRTGSSLDTLGP